MKISPKSELKCDKCHEETPVRVSNELGLRLCKKCIDLAKKHETNN